MALGKRLVRSVAGVALVFTVLATHRWWTDRRSLPAGPEWRTGFRHVESPPSTEPPEGAEGAGPPGAKQVSSWGAVVDRDLSMPENAPLVEWLNTPRPELQPVPPRLAPLPYARWEDHSSRVDVIDGTPYLSDRPPQRFAISVTVDHALADAIEAQFGFPKDAHQPTSYSWEAGGTRRPLDAMLERKARLIERAHGFRVNGERLEPDYDWLVDKSASICTAVAPAVVEAFTERPIADADARERVEALASFVQNAIPYRFDVEGAVAAKHSDGKNRLGIRPPATTLLHGGDCDCKSLLLAALIRAADPEVPLAVVGVRVKDEKTGEMDPHAVLGVGVPSRPGEQTLDAGGARLLLIETTAGSHWDGGDWDLGHLGNGTDLNSPEIRWIRQR